MSVHTRPRMYKVLSVVFLLSLVSSLFVANFVPYLVAEPGKGVYMTKWIFLVALMFGAIAVATVPFAWRWAYRRRE